MPVWEMPPVSVAELAALERDYRYGESRLVRQRSQIVRLAYALETQVEIARAVRVAAGAAGVARRAGGPELAAGAGRGDAAGAASLRGAAADLDGAAPG